MAINVIIPLTRGTIKGGPPEEKSGGSNRKIHNTLRLLMVSFREVIKYFSYRNSWCPSWDPSKIFLDRTKL